MNRRIYDKLIEVARAQTTVYYSDIAPLAELTMHLTNDRRKLGQILEEISRAEVADARPMLSAIVILKGEEIPSEGFYVLAKDLGLQGVTESDYDFYRRELTRVHDAWRVAELAT